MQMIDPPLFSVSEMARTSQCRATFAAAVKELVFDAVANGWRQEEVALALADAADEYVLYLASRPTMVLRHANQNNTSI